MTSEMVLLVRGIGTREGLASVGCCTGGGIEGCRPAVGTSKRAGRRPMSFGNWPQSAGLLAREFDRDRLGFVPGAGDGASTCGT